MFLGDVEIAKAFLGTDLVFQKGGVPPTPPTPSRLPDGYTEVEYIENTTNAWIATGVSGNLKWSLKARSNGILTQTQALVGKGTSSIIWFGVYLSTSVWGCGSTQVSNTSAFSDTTMDVVFNGKVVTATIGSDGCTRTFSSSNSSAYTLFNVGSSKQYPFIGRLYGDAVALNGSTEVFRGVPCIDPNNVVGLYDLISNTFKSSGNSSTFVAGPAIS